MAIFNFSSNPRSKLVTQDYQVNLSDEVLILSDNDVINLYLPQTNLNLIEGKIYLIFNPLKEAVELTISVRDSRVIYNSSDAFQCRYLEFTTGEWNVFDCSEADIDIKNVEYVNELSYSRNNLNYHTIRQSNLQFPLSLSSEAEIEPLDVNDETELITLITPFNEEFILNVVDFDNEEYQLVIPPIESVTADDCYRNATTKISEFISLQVEERKCNGAFNPDNICSGIFIQTTEAPLTQEQTLNISDDDFIELNPQYTDDCFVYSSYMSNDNTIHLTGESIIDGVLSFKTTIGYNPINDRFYDPITCWDENRIPEDPTLIDGIYSCFTGVTAEDAGINTSCSPDIRNYNYVPFTLIESSRTNRQFGDTFENPNDNISVTYDVIRNPCCNEALTIEYNYPGITITPTEISDDFFELTIEGNRNFEDFSFSTLNLDINGCGHYQKLEIQLTPPCDNIFTKYVTQYRLEQWRRYNQDGSFFENLEDIDISKYNIGSCFEYEISNVCEDKVELTANVIGESNLFQTQQNYIYLTTNNDFYILPFPLQCNENPNEDDKIIVDTEDDDDKINPSVDTENPNVIDNGDGTYTIQIPVNVSPIDIPVNVILPPNIDFPLNGIQLETPEINFTNPFLEFLVSGENPLDRLFGTIPYIDFIRGDGNPERIWTPKNDDLSCEGTLKQLGFEILESTYVQTQYNINFSYNLYKICCQDPVEIELVDDWDGLLSFNYTISPNENKLVSLQTGTIDINLNASSEAFNKLSDRFIELLITSQCIEEEGGEKTYIIRLQTEGKTNTICLCEGVDTLNTIANELNQYRELNALYPEDWSFVESDLNSGDIDDYENGDIFSIKIDSPNYIDSCPKSDMVLTDDCYYYTYQYDGESAYVIAKPKTGNLDGFTMALNNGESNICKSDKPINSEWNPSVNNDNCPEGTTSLSECLGLNCGGGINGDGEQEECKEPCCEEEDISDKIYPNRCNCQYFVVNWIEDKIYEYLENEETPDLNNTFLNEDCGYELNFIQDGDNIKITSQADDKRSYIGGANYNQNTSGYNTYLIESSTVGQDVNVDVSTCPDVIPSGWQPFSSINENDCLDDIPCEPDFSIIKLPPGSNDENDEENCISDFGIEIVPPGLDECLNEYPECVPDFEIFPDGDGGANDDEDEDCIPDFDIEDIPPLSDDCSDSEDEDCIPDIEIINDVPRDGDDEPPGFRIGDDDCIGCDDEDEDCIPDIQIFPDGDGGGNDDKYDEDCVSDFGIEEIPPFSDECGDSEDEDCIPDIEIINDVPRDEGDEPPGFRIGDDDCVRCEGDEDDECIPDIQIFPDGNGSGNGDEDDEDCIPDFGIEEIPPILGECDDSDEEDCIPDIEIINDVPRDEGDEPPGFRFGNEDCVGCEEDEDDENCIPSIEFFPDGDGGGNGNDEEDDEDCVPDFDIEDIPPNNECNNENQEECEPSIEIANDVFREDDDEPPAFKVQSDPDTCGDEELEVCIPSFEIIPSVLSEPESEECTPSIDVIEESPCGNGSGSEENEECLPSIEIINDVPRDNEDPNINILDLYPDEENCPNLVKTCYEPNNLRILDSGTSWVIIGWDKPQEGIDALTPSYYNVYYRISGDEWALYDTSISESKQITGLDAIRDYQFKVSAVCCSSDDSNVITYSNGEENVCNAPNNFSVYATYDNGFLLGWDPPTTGNNVIDVNTYLIWQRKKGETVWEGPTTVNPRSTSNDYEADGLDSNTEYEFQIKTLCTNGSTSAARYTEGITDGQECNPISSIEVFIEEDRSPTLRVYSNETEDFQIRAIRPPSYIVERDAQGNILNSDFWSFQTTNTFTYDAPNQFIDFPSTITFREDRQYDFLYTFEAICQDGSSTEFEIIFTIPVADCEPPENTNVEDVTSSTVDISWSDPLTSATVEYTERNQSNWRSTNATQITDNRASITGLRDSTAYDARVINNCNGLNSPNSTSNVSFTTNPNPCQPPEDYIITEANPNSATFSWNPNSANNPNESYSLDWKEEEEQIWNTEDNIQTTNYQINNLQPNTNYNTRISTECSGNPSSYEYIDFSTPQTQVAPITGDSTVPNYNSFSSTFQVDQSPQYEQPTSFEVAYQRDNNPQIMRQTVTEPEIEVSNLIENQTYNVEVSPKYNDISASTYSYQVQTNQRDCNVPVNIAYEIDSDDITVSWGSYIQTNIFSELSNWIIRYGEDTNPFTYNEVILQPNILSYQIQNLDTNSVYRIEIHSTCANDTTSFDFIDDIEFTPCICDDITNASSIVNGTDVEITWINIQDAQNYLIEICDSGENCTNYNTNINSLTLNNNQHNEVYYFTIQADCGLCQSNVSNTFNFATDPAPCGAPDFATINNISSNSVSGSISQFPPPNQTITSNTVTYNPVNDPNDSSSVTTVTDSFTLNNLMPDTEYEAQVRATCSEGGDSNFTPIANFTTLSNTCNPPVNLSSNTQTVNSIAVVWDYPLDFSNVINFELQYKNSTSSSWITIPIVSTNNYTLNSLLENMSYDVRVRSFCGNGVYSSFATNTFTTSIAPCNLPQNLNIDYVDQNRIDVSWNAPTMPSSPPSNYIVRYKKDTDLNWVSEIDVGNILSYSITMLDAGTNYVIEVYTECVNNTNSTSSQLNASTMNTQCQPISNLSVIMGPTTAVLSWDVSSIPEVTDNYEIQYVDVLSNTQTITTTSTTHTFTGLVPNTSHDFYVNAYCDNDLSNVLTITDNTEVCATCSDPDCLTYCQNLISPNQGELIDVSTAYDDPNSKWIATIQFSYQTDLTQCQITGFNDFKTTVTAEEEDGVISANITNQSSFDVTYEIQVVYDTLPGSDTITAKLDIPCPLNFDVPILSVNY